MTTIFGQKYHWRKLMMMSSWRSKVNRGQMWKIMFYWYDDDRSTEVKCSKLFSMTAIFGQKTADASLWRPYAPVKFFQYWFSLYQLLDETASLPFVYRCMFNEMSSLILNSRIYRLSTSQMSRGNYSTTNYALTSLNLRLPIHNFVHKFRIFPYLYHQHMHFSGLLVFYLQNHL